MYHLATQVKARVKCAIKAQKQPTEGGKTHFHVCGLKRKIVNKFQSVTNF